MLPGSGQGGGNESNPPAVRGWAMRHGRRKRIVARRRELGGEGGCGRAVLSRSVGTSFGKARRWHYDGSRDSRQALCKARTASSREFRGWNYADVESLLWGKTTKDAEDEECE